VTWSCCAERTHGGKSKRVSIVSRVIVREITVCRHDRSDDESAGRFERERKFKLLSRSIFNVLFSLKLLPK
jgi:hypothetical protein